MFDGEDEAGHPLAAHHPVHHAPSRRHRPARVGSGLGAVPGLRPGAQRVGAGLGQRPDPPVGHPEPGVRRAGHRGRGGAVPVRVPARCVPVRRSSPCRVRGGHRPVGGHLRRRGQHPRRHRLPEDPVRIGPDDRRAQAGGAGRAAPSSASSPSRRRTDRSAVAADDLFSGAAAERLSARAPLAARMRPRTLDEIVGQQHLVGPGRTPAGAHRIRPADLGHPVGPARDRQDHPGLGAGHGHGEALRPAVGGERRGQGRARGGRGGPSGYSASRGGGRSSSWTRSTGSTAPSRTPSCPRSKRA